MVKIKQNLSLILVTFATVILAVIAVTTAIKLKQAGTEPVAPTAPQPAPAREPASSCKLTFTIGGPSVTPTTTPRITSTPTTTPKITPTLTTTPTSTPKITSTPGPTNTPPPGPTETPAPGPTNTPAPGPTATPTPVQLPKAGVSLPTVGAIIGGAILVITSLFLLI